MSPLFCAILILAVAVPVQGYAAIPATPATPDPTNVSEWMYSVSGKEVSAGEWLEHINPGYLSSLTEEKREWYYQLNVTMPDRTSAPGSMQFGARAISVAAIAVPDCPVPTPTEPDGPGKTGTSHQCTIDQSSAGMIDPFAEAGMSVGEYLQIVCPDYVTSLPECHRASLFNESLREMAVSFPEESAPHSLAPGPGMGFGSLVFGPGEIALSGIGFVLIIGIAAYGAYRILRKGNRR
ncbi:MAG: hypothetical protein ABFC24_04150 [Methanoregulaceae archaeon]